MTANLFFAESEVTSLSASNSHNDTLHFLWWVKLRSVERELKLLLNFSALHKQMSQFPGFSLNDMATAFWVEERNHFAHKTKTAAQVTERPRKHNTTCTLSHVCILKNGPNLL
jgi:hypothetical protein